MKIEFLAEEKLNNDQDLIDQFKDLRELASYAITEYQPAEPYDVVTLFGYAYQEFICNRINHDDIVSGQGIEVDEAKGLLSEIWKEIQNTPFDYRMSVEANPFSVFLCNLANVVFLREVCPDKQGNIPLVPLNVQSAFSYLMPDFGGSQANQGLITQDSFKQLSSCPQNGDAQGMGVAAKNAMAEESEAYLYDKWNLSSLSLDVINKIVEVLTKNGFSNTFNQEKHPLSLFTLQPVCFERILSVAILRQSLDARLLQIKSQDCFFSEQDTLLYPLNKKPERGYLLLNCLRLDRHFFVMKSEDGTPSDFRFNAFLLMFPKIESQPARSQIFSAFCDANPDYTDFFRRSDLVLQIVLFISALNGEQKLDFIFNLFCVAQQDNFDSILRMLEIVKGGLNHVKDEISSASQFILSQLKNHIVAAGADLNVASSSAFFGKTNIFAYPDGGDVAQFVLSFYQNLKTKKSDSAELQRWGAYIEREKDKQKPEVLAASAASAASSNTLNS